MSESASPFPFVKLYSPEELFRPRCKDLRGIRKVWLVPPMSVLLPAIVGRLFLREKRNGERFVFPIEFCNVALPKAIGGCVP